MAVLVILPIFISGKRMHNKPMRSSDGEFGDWKPTKSENPDFKCRECGSREVWYRVWESSCGGHEDVNYECRGCRRTWWVDGADG